MKRNQVPLFIFFIAIVTLPVPCQITSATASLKPTASVTNAQIFTESDTSSAAATPGSIMNERALLASTTAEYPVTPGDVYRLAFLRGTSVQSMSIVVNIDFQVNIGVFGIMSSRGMTFVQFKKIVENLVASAYPGSMPQVLVESTGVFNVMCFGETVAAGEYSAWGLTRLSALVNSVTTPWTSLRSIQVKSADGTSNRYDLFLASRYGNLENNPYLRPGDEVTLARLDRAVTISGLVRRPGTYQLLPGETLADLVETYAQGFTERADTNRLVIKRILDNDSSMGQQFNVGYQKNKDFSIMNCDAVTVASLEELLPVVWFEGALGVDETGSSLDASAHQPITFMPGERLSTVVQKIRSRIGSASALDEAYIRRGDKNIPVNLNTYLYDKDFSVDHELQPNDTIVIPFRQLFITVSGAVQAPGRYPYIPDRGWEYYVALAGGFDKEKNAWDAIDIMDRQRTIQSKNRTIQPEDMITARYNSFLYIFGRVATILTTVLSVASIVISIVGLSN